MKKYFLVCEKSDGRYRVSVSDAVGAGRTALMEIEAPSCAAAVKMVSFSVHGIGCAAFCGIDSNGKAYAGTC